MFQVKKADGFVPEHDMVETLEYLGILVGNGQPLHVVSMSFGYYHEAPDDARTDASLVSVLQPLAAAGCLLVASAGNDATTRRMFPAALDHRDIGAKLDILSVGALNPNGTVALFSNAGDWVDVYEAGAAVVSTLPTTFDASLQATARTENPDGQVRESIDPDDFSGGFGAWSGTSFAAPIVAGHLAQDLLDRWTRSTGKRAVNPKVSRRRVVAALEKARRTGPT